MNALINERKVWISVWTLPKTSATSGCKNGSAIQSLNRIQLEYCNFIYRFFCLFPAKCHGTVIIMTESGVCVLRHNNIITNDDDAKQWPMRLQPAWMEGGPPAINRWRPVAWYDDNYKLIEWVYVVYRDGRSQPWHTSERRQVAQVHERGNVFMA